MEIVTSGLFVIFFCFLSGYLSGSIPFGLILARFFLETDLRDIGSGNIGATNVARTGKKSLAAITLLCDVFKATLPILLGIWLIENPDASTAILAIAAGTLIGHIFPVWLRFRGGKGIATLLGILLALHWPAAICFLFVWVYCFLFTRISSFSGLTSTLSAPIFLYMTGETYLSIFIAMLAILVWITHYQNLKRIFCGQEAHFKNENKDIQGA